jgi:hypothetical protein
MDDDTIAAIRLRAMELADVPPPLSTEQASLLISMVRRYPSTQDGSSSGERRVHHDH